MAEKLKKRKGIFLSFHMMETLLMLPPEQQEKLMLACYAYHKGEEPDLSDVKVAFAFKAFKEEFDAATAHYKEVCEARTAAINERWKNTKNIQNDTNVSVSDSNEYKGHTFVDQEQVQEQDINNNTPNGVFVAADGSDAVEPADEGKADKLPPCPHGEIVALYHEILPELPRVKVWDGTRKTHLQARWREALARQHINDKSGGLDYWRRYFGYVRKCPLLMGQVTQRDGRAWRADLPWLVKAENYAKVIEGRYMPEGNHERS